MTSPSSSRLAASVPAERLFLILRQLNRAYGRPARARRGDPLDSLIGTVLSQNTTDVNSGRAFEQLKGRFSTWEKVLEARPREIATAIRSGGLGEIKSRRIKRILRQIEQDRGRLDLGFLRRMAPERAREYLLGLSGVGPKTAACVLLFALGKPVFPVDTHVLRVSKRLGVLPPTTSMERAHDIFAAVLDSQEHSGGRAQWDHRAVLALHLGMVRHGREVCRPRRPRCGSCALREVCLRVGVGRGGTLARRGE